MRSTYSLKSRSNRTSRVSARGEREPSGSELAMRASVSAVPERARGKVEAPRVAEGGPQALQGAQEELRGRAARAIHAPGDLLHGKPLDTGKEDHLPVVGAESPEGLL